MPVERDMIAAADRAVARVRDSVNVAARPNPYTRLEAVQTPLVRLSVLVELLQTEPDGVSLTALTGSLQYLRDQLRVALYADLGDVEDLAAAGGSYAPWARELVSLLYAGRDL